MTITQSPRAASLDLTDLPIGTVVQWFEPRGFEPGHYTRWGTIVKVERKNYGIETYSHNVRFLRRDRKSVAEKELMVLRTAEEDEERQAAKMSRFIDEKVFINMSQASPIVVRDDRDGFTFVRDEDGKLFTVQSAKRFAASRDYTNDYQVYRLVKIEPVVTD